MMCPRCDNNHTLANGNGQFFFCEDCTLTIHQNGTEEVQYCITTEKYSIFIYKHFTNIYRRNQPIIGLNVIHLKKALSLKVDDDYIDKLVMLA